ncbi:hypothetical protein E2C01_020836 [Portunus trituberculatus]|uniref:Uncharacterized protein n=1 Tax=Portunus trituberculatus TaxID=210409 RepID=A0A5B7E2N8_PORTR|nr:hypothetical protein [Portunus trituberculatus]
MQAMSQKSFHLHLLSFLPELSAVEVSAPRSTNILAKANCFSLHAKNSGPRRSAAPPPRPPLRTPPPCAGPSSLGGGEIVTLHNTGTREHKSTESPMYSKARTKARLLFLVAFIRDEKFFTEPRGVSKRTSSSSSSRLAWLSCGESSVVPWLLAPLLNKS